MIKRPICWALVLLVTGIFLSSFFLVEKEEELSGEDMTLTCQVSQIAGLDAKSLTVTSVTYRDSLLCKKLKVYQGKDLALFSDLKIGNIIEIHGNLSPYKPPGNPGQFDEKSYYESQGISASFFCDSCKILDDSYRPLPQALQDFRNSFCQNLLELLPQESAGLLCAMLMGEKSSLEEEVKEVYRQGGISHIIAISGLHISMIGAGLFYFLRKYLLPMRLAAVTTIFALILYGELTGFSISATRAILMMIILLLARMIGATYDGWNALALAAFVQLVIQPQALFQAGFLLSYGTLAGIFFFVPQWKEWTDSLTDGKKMILANFGMFLITLPIILYFYYEVNILSALINTLVLPCMGILMALGLGGGFSAYICQLLSQMFLGTAHYFLKYFYYLSDFMSGLPFIMWRTGQPLMWQIYSYYFFLLLFVLARKSKKHKNLCLPAILFALALLFIPIHRVEGLEIYSLDIGQGDCTVLRYKNQTMMIDGGSSSVKEIAKYRIVPWLKYHGISRLDRIFITHSDSDHNSGILEMAEESGHFGIEVGQVILPKIKEKDEGYLAMEECFLSVDWPVAYMERGEKLVFDQDFSLRCLHPYPDYKWPDENNYSLVLELSYKNFKGLFVGDLGMEGEAEILPYLSSVDFLKVGHHGSKNSSGSDFLSALSPRYASISCGKNRYGHPSPEALERLKSAGVTYASTITSGQIKVVPKDDGVVFEKYLE
ncbi:MAG: DNA internalization-related competence protein ComEC/Rec2 [Eubacterium sp.]|nr:DNA internalization-related competence protein ComEC/Rec2 [Eubacterium sp.]